MTRKEFQKQVKQTAQAVRKAGGSIKINHGLPWIAVVNPDGSEYYFQESEAQALLDEVPDDVNESDFILWLAQGW